MPPAVASLLPEGISTRSRNAIGDWFGGKTVEWLGAFQAREGAEELVYEFPARNFEQVTYWTMPII